MRQKKDESISQGSSLLHLQFKNKDPRQTGPSCLKEVSGASCISNQLDPHHLQWLFQHHQHIPDTLQDQLKVSAIFKALFATKILNLLEEQQLHSALYGSR